MWLQNGLGDVDFDSGVVRGVQSTTFLFTYVYHEEPLLFGEAVNEAVDRKNIMR